MLPPLPPAGLCLLYTMPALSCLEYCNKMVLSSSTSAASTALVCELETDKLCAWLLTGLGEWVGSNTQYRQAQPVRLPSPGSVAIRSSTSTSPM
ncbi:hypothetical protein AK812_SmicGene33971 [Symbiodinium microadriaticum]|uniref:Uncharacterized protein n=1 Tax=Symbiodinium microadriaticum TaxID=2951 RepID=A0A1Q9CQ76_SYMMI|nr:hypothetical protein AK812_SmicGene33971 [Symbiodinium microadriaticum]